MIKLIGDIQGLKNKCQTGGDSTIRTLFGRKYNRTVVIVTTQKTTQQQKLRNSI